MSGCTVTCTCGHTADFDEFTVRPVSGPLPRGQYQCPACNKAWRIDNREGEARRLANGFVIVPPTTLIPIAPRL